MGNDTSDFEKQFYKIYSFISLVEDPYFKTVKIYRKNRHSFNHIMIAQTSIMDFPHRSRHISSSSYITQKLSLIRRFQDRYTVHLQHFHLLQQKYECGSPTIRMYIDYYNYTLLDYLTALRVKKQYLTIDELTLLIQNLAEAFITLKKMGLQSYQINVSNIYLVVEEGVILLNPIYLLYDSIYQAYNTKAIHALSHQFQIFSSKQSSEIKPDFSEQQRKQKQQIHSLVIQMTRYLSKGSLQQSQSILEKLEKCGTIEQISTAFVCEIDQLNVQQFGQASPQNAQLY